MPELVKLILHFLNGLPKEMVVIILSMLPIAEIRLGLPIALFVMKFSLAKAFFISVIGNIIIIAPVLFLLTPVTTYFERFKFGKKFFAWYFQRTRNKAKVIERWEFWGLVIFVGIPLPMTGAWTGCIAASLFKMRFSYAFFANVLGVMLAGIIVSILCLTGRVILTL